jgi:hypothetical protein
MRSSGIKRGLAAIAVSAVAVTGIPALAMANSIDTQVTAANGPTGVELLNPAFDMTSKNDGTDSTVRLEAGGGINVAQVTFQISDDGGAFFDVATVSRNDDGAFSFEWNPAADLVGPGSLVQVRVLNAAVPAQQDTNPAVTLRNATAATTQAINITAGEQKGYFVDPDVPTQQTLGVTGTTSVTSVLPADRPVLGSLNGAGGFNDLQLGTNAGDGTWDGVVRFASPPYIFDDPALPPAEADQIVIDAFTNVTSVPSNQTDDLEAFTLYAQTLTSLTATVTPAEEPDPGTVTVTVLDQNSNPIAGIDVYRSNGTQVPGETNGRGQITDPLSDSVQYYYANATGPDGFSPAAGDKRSNDVQNLAANVSVVTSPSDGRQPIGTTVTETITVTDANGDPISNRSVRIRRNGPGGQAETKFVTTNSNGVATYDFTCNVAGVTSIAVGIFGPNPPDPLDPYTFATANDTVRCGDPRTTIVARLRGNNRGNRDVLKVNAPTRAAGATVRLQKKTRNGWRQVGATKSLNALGNKSFSVRDRNGNRVTVYRAKVAATSDTRADTTNKVRRR